MGKIIIEWKDYTMTEDVAASLSSHALERAAERVGEPIMQLRLEVESLVNQAEDTLIDLSQTYKTFLLKGKRGLAVVGALLKNGVDYIFKVITLHKKKNFVPNNPNDKVIDLSEDKINGGLADNVSLVNFDKGQLMKGIKIEMEHTSDIEVAIEIASDHLTEDPQYYDKLEQMEKDFEGRPETTIPNNLGNLGADEIGLGDSLVVNLRDPESVDQQKKQTEQKLQLRRSLEANINGLEDLSLQLLFNQNKEKEQIKKALEILYALHGTLAINRALLPSNVIPANQMFAEDINSDSHETLQYAKRFINQQFLNKPSNVQTLSSQNYGEDLEQELQEIEFEDREVNSLVIKPELEFVTKDLLSNEEVIVNLDLEEYYKLKRQNSPGSHSTPEYKDIDSSLISKTWLKIYIGGNECLVDSELKSMLDQVFKYPKK